MASWSRAPSQPFGAPSDPAPLLRDTLVRVVAQIRFAPIMSVRDHGFVAPFQEAIRAAYPLINKEIQQRGTPDGRGVLEGNESIVWRFMDASDTWQVSLSDDFISLDCSTYSSRDDFTDRLRQTLEAVRTHIRPVLVHRVGVRYIDQVSDPSFLERLEELIRPELLGVAGCDLGTAEMIGHLTQADFETNGVSMRGRWGHLPAGSKYDPSVEALNAPSWVLDLDAYTVSTAPFDAALCIEEVERYTSIAYDFFRWAVSDEFLQAHGAAS